jgi:hypothetical protein
MERCGFGPADRHLGLDPGPKNIVFFEMFLRPGFRRDDG